MARAKKAPRVPKANHSRNRPLTPKQLKCLKALHWYITKHGVAPTQKELSHMLGLKSEQGCKSYLTALVKKGYIKREKDAWRGIVVLIHPMEAERQSKLLQHQNAKRKQEIAWRRSQQ